MPSILILGGDGMLGHKMFQVLREQFPDTSCTIRGSRNDEAHRLISLFQEGEVIGGVDAMDLPSLMRLIEVRRPEVIVNCIGVIKQRSDARSAIPSITINALLPHQLADRSARWNGKIIHFSTDCVFSGRRGGYSEEDPSDAEDLYGKTKFLGETAEANALTLRTSIIGRELFNFKSLLEWFLHQEGSVIRGFTRHFYSGVTTNYLSNLVAKLIVERPDLFGLYQVTSPTITKHDLLRLLREAFSVEAEIAPDEIPFCDRSMKGGRFVGETGYRTPDWPELCRQLAEDPTPYEKWR